MLDRRLRLRRGKYRLRDGLLGRVLLSGMENELGLFVGESGLIEDLRESTFIARRGDVPTTSETL